MLTVATLVKRRSANGLIEVKDHVTIGKTYVVDLRTLRTATLCHLPTGEVYEAQVIWECESGRWLAMELLAIEAWLARPNGRVH